MLREHFHSIRGKNGDISFLSLLTRTRIMYLLFVAAVVAVVMAVVMMVMAVVAVVMEC